MQYAENTSEINEWRIKTMSFGAPHAMIETNWGAIIGGLFFIIGLVAAIEVKALSLISFFGLALGLASIFFKGRSIRRNWFKVSARCTDREYKRVLSLASRHGGVRGNWTFRILCEFELDNKQYTVTPRYWSTFISESRLQKFLNKTISPDGKCQLWVNPKNPLQTELSANDIKDLLLH